MNQQKQQFRNITYLSDTSGTGFWRHIQQTMAINCIGQSIGVSNTYSQTPVLDQNYYHGATSVTVQRWINDAQLDLFTRFLKPICDNNGAWLIYGIDDAMHYDEIPLYNRGRAAFANDKIQSNIKTMLNAADFVITTTGYIKKYYNEKYGVPLENILAVPNLLPKWWFDDKYDVEKSVADFSKFRAKPRIGIVSSLSHYNVDNVREDENGKAVKEVDQNGTKKWINQDNVEVLYDQTKAITDDIDDIIDVIRSTVDEFQWVFFGFCPPKLNDLVDAKKIEVHGGTPILNYPSMLKKLHLQAIVAPVKRMTFNYCKSPIKYIECCAIGTPLFATNCQPYTDYMDRSMLFDNSEELTSMLRKLKFMSTGAYRKIIEGNYKWFNTPRRDGDFNVKNYWLEDNLGIWIDIFRMRSKTLNLSMSRFIEQYEQHMKEEAEKTLYKAQNGVEITK